MTVRAISDRLQRTAPWVDSLDGGLERVREVVVDDPKKLARFVPFVHAPGVPDPNIAFTEQRGQIRARDTDGRVSLGPPSRSVPRDDRCSRDPRRPGVRVSNFDPFSEASVLARGIVGTQTLSVDGDDVAVPCVASPMHKQRFDLRTGVCLEDESVAVPTYPARVTADGKVVVDAEPA